MGTEIGGHQLEDNSIRRAGEHTEKLDGPIQWTGIMQLFEYLQIFSCCLQSNFSMLVVVMNGKNAQLRIMPDMWLPHYCYHPYYSYQHEKQSCHWHLHCSPSLHCAAITT